ncbi:MAG: hypothetical protein P4L87_13020 [Formivibrio sp.]|nr:hypothetical protein [Formivibrio sp.]
MRWIHTRSRGAALLLLMFVLSIMLSLALIGVYARPRNLAQQAEITTQSLAQAKLSLIAWSLSQKATSYNRSRPGEFPCPDLHAPGEEYEGWPGTASDDSCNTNARRIGRLPWNTLGLPKLVDGSGETLWYMVVSPFHDSNTAALNSNTAQPYNLHAFANGGSTAYPGAIAILFAPGSLLAGQVRNNASQQITPANYLEHYGSYNNASTSPTITRLNGPLTNATGTLLVNDQLVVITAADILPKVLQRAVAEYPVALKKKYPLPPYPPAQEGGCIGTPPSVEMYGIDSDWLNRNAWETLLRYDCSTMAIQKK